MLMENPAGNRFSQLYGYSADQIKDSARFRHRLAVLTSEYCDGPEGAPYRQLAHLIERECGIKVPRPYNYDIAKVVNQGELRDVLDIVTLTHTALGEWQYSAAQKRDQWGAQMERLFREERLSYRVDEKCVVHYLVDEAFTHATAATIGCLNRPSHAAARDALDKAFSALDGHPQDTKGAITYTFEAAEILAKLLVPAARNLHNKLCQVQLKALYRATLTTQAETDAAGKAFDGMAEWVDAVHNFRHGQAVQAVASPSVEITAFLMNTGLGFIRCLAPLVP